MSEAIFQKTVLEKLLHLENGLYIMKHEIHILKEKMIDDAVLTDEDKRDIDVAVREEQEGKLLSKAKVFS